MLRTPLQKTQSVVYKSVSPPLLSSDRGGEECGVELRGASGTHMFRWGPEEE